MRRTALVLIPAVLVLAACGEPSAPSVTGPNASLTDAAAIEEALSGTPAEVGGPYGELRDGVWEIGAAGEVEFRVAGDDLELVEARVNDGWTITEQKDGSNQIEVDYRSGPVSYDFEVELRRGVMKLQIDQKIEPAEPGSFAIGEAGTAPVSVADGRLVLGDVSLAEGWAEAARDGDKDDFQLDLRRDGADLVELWKLKGDLKRDKLEIEVDYEIEGRLAQ